MATRASQQLQYGIIRTYVVAATKTVTVGKTVKFTDATVTPPTIEDAGSASDIAFGVVIKNNTPVNSSGISTASTIGTSVAAAGIVEVALYGNMIAKMLCGTGGSTAGKKQKVVSDGVTDVGTAGFTTDVESVGIALETAVVGDAVSVLSGGINSRGV